MLKRVRDVAQALDSSPERRALVAEWEARLKAEGLGVVRLLTEGDSPFVGFDPEVANVSTGASCWDGSAWASQLADDVRALPRSWDPEARRFLSAWADRGSLAAAARAVGLALRPPKSPARWDRAQETRNSRSKTTGSGAQLPPEARRWVSQFRKWQRERKEAA